MAGISDVYKVDDKKYGSLKEAYGFFRGICEDNQDPKGLGRIKVRIPSIHGAAIGGSDFLDTATSETNLTGKGIQTIALPWAWPCFKSGGVYDSGEYDIPLVGTGIWIGFEQGDPDYPIWFGTWPSMPQGKLEANTINGWNLPSNADVISMGTWNQPSGLSTPKEIHDSFEDPQVRILAKTPKGATIMAIDTDESETLMIIDRSGQMVEMYSPITSSKNADNFAQRGIRTVRDNDSLDPSVYGKDSKAYIRIIDTSYQTNQSGQRYWSGQFIKLSAEKDKELVRIHGTSGHDILLDSTLGDAKIVIKDNIGNFIFMNKDGIKIKSKLDEKITIEGNVELDILGDYTLKTDGKCEIDCNIFVLKSNSSTINATGDLIFKTKDIIINTTSSLDIKSTTVSIGAVGTVEINAGSSIVESSSTNVTKAGSISHISGSGTTPNVDNPVAPEKAGDPAGTVEIPNETFPVG